MTTNSLVLDQSFWCEIWKFADIFNYFGICEIIFIELASYTLKFIQWRSIEGAFKESRSHLTPFEGKLIFHLNEIIIMIIPRVPRNIFSVFFKSLSFPLIQKRDPNRCTSNEYRVENLVQNHHFPSFLHFKFDIMPSNAWNIDIARFFRIFCCLFKLFIINKSP